MIEIIIIENDENALKFLQNLILKEFPEIKILDTAKNLVDSNRILKHYKPDLVLMDIELDDGLSFKLLDDLNSYDFEIIFISAFDTYYKQAFEHFALSYILKPYSKEDLARVLSHYLTKKDKRLDTSAFGHLRTFLKNTSSKILVQTGDSYESILIDNIVCLKADGNYALFILSNKKRLLANQGLKYYTTLFEPKGFFRANRFCLVNLSHLRSIHQKETLILSNNDKVSVSVRNKTNLKTLIETLK